MATDTGVGYDERLVTPGTAEELAGPAHAELPSLAPVTIATRPSKMLILNPTPGDSRRLPQHILLGTLIG